MNRLYYSNYCPHSRRVLEFIKQNNLINSLDFFCLDNRVRDKKTGIIYIINENHKRRDALPPNVQEVPALLLVRDNYRAILGKAIIDYYSPKDNPLATLKQDEPAPISLGDSMAFSSFGDATISDTLGYIETPPDDGKSNKIGEEITVEMLQRKRDADLGINI